MQTLLEGYSPVDHYLIAGADILQHAALGFSIADRRHLPHKGFWGIRHQLLCLRAEPRFSQCPSQEMQVIIKVSTRQFTSYCQEISQDTTRCASWWAVRKPQVQLPGTMPFSQIQQHEQ